MNVLNQADALSDVAVELYDTIHRGNGGDVGFYVGLCQGVRRVVEFGVGTGRIALALARAGTEVVGVELDSAGLFHRS